MIELTKTNSFNPTPKLKSIPISILFIPFISNDCEDKCHYCEFKICKTYTHNIQDWICSEIFYFKQMNLRHSFFFASLILYIINYLDVANYVRNQLIIIYVPIVI